MNLFISWSGPYARRIAESLEAAILKLSVKSDPDKNAVVPFVSSQDIESGKKWRTELGRRLSKAKCGIIVLTQDMLESHWLPHEVGALSIKCKKLVFVKVDTPMAMIPDPFKDYQIRSTSNEDLARLLTEIASDAGAESPSPYILNTLFQQVKEIREDNRWRFVTADDSRWEGKLERPFAITMQDESPYDLKEVMSLPRQRLVMVAQNHGFMTLSEAEKGLEDISEESWPFWPRIAALLKAGVDVDIVTMQRDIVPPPYKAGSSEPDNRADTAPDAVATWAHFMGNDSFFGHVETTLTTLKRWMALSKTIAIAGKNRAGKLQIWGSYLTPVTMTFVDADTTNGLLILSPRMAHESNTSRPQIIIKKAACPSIFSYYWGTVKNNFVNGGWQRIAD